MGPDLSLRREARVTEPLGVSICTCIKITDPTLFRFLRPSLVKEKRSKGHERRNQWRKGLKFRMP